MCTLNKSCVGEKKNVRKILVGKPARKIPLGCSRNTWEDDDDDDDNNNNNNRK
jgi:hypothetical protein